MMKVSDFLKNFGYPHTLIKEYNNWYLLLRVPQATLGSLVLMCKDNVERYSEISSASNIEFHEIIREIENSLKTLFNYKKLNYLMLMMVDNIVHYHIIPRYDNDINLFNKSYKDFSWPVAPDLSKYNEISNIERDKIIKHIQNILKPNIKNKKYNIIYTTGVFDVFHYGHLNILRKSKELCNYLIVGVSTDELVRKKKNKKPLVQFEERCNIINSIVYVDEVIPQNDNDKQKVVNKYNIDAITVGSDWRGRYPGVTCDLIYIDYTPLISSTKIRNSI